MNNVISKGLHTIAYAWLFQYDECKQLRFGKYMCVYIIISKTLIKAYLG